MESISLPIKCLKTKFDNFNSLKHHILSNLEDSPNKHETISEVDWDNSADFNRPWVKCILPHLNYNLTKMVKTQQYSNIVLENVWYQRYNTQDYHGWHVHSGHYTGVLYLEYPKETPPTQLLFDNKITNIKASEGDIIIFPSLVIHRSPINESHLHKTIISFNFRIDIDFVNLDQ